MICLVVLFFTSVMVRPVISGCHSNYTNGSAVVALGDWRTLRLDTPSDEPTDVAAALLAGAARAKLEGAEMALVFANELANSSIVSGSTPQPALVAAASAMAPASAAAALLGPSFSSSQNALSSLATVRELPILSYAATASTLSGSAGFTRTIPPDNARAVSAISLLERFRWLSRFALIVPGDDFGRSYAGEMGQLVGDVRRRQRAENRQMGFPELDPAVELARVIELDPSGTSDALTSSLRTEIDGLVTRDIAILVIHTFEWMLPAIASAARSALPPAVQLRVIFTAGLSLNGVLALPPDDAFALNDALLVAPPTLVGNAGVIQFLSDLHLAKTVMRQSAVLMSQASSVEEQLAVLSELDRMVDVTANLLASSSASESSSSLSTNADGSSSASNASLSLDGVTSISPFAYDAARLAAIALSAVQRDSTSSASKPALIGNATCMEMRNRVLRSSVMALPEQPEPLAWSASLISAFRSNSSQFSGATGVVTINKGSGDRDFVFAVRQLRVLSSSVTVSASVSDVGTIRAAGEPSRNEVSLSADVIWDGGFRVGADPVSPSLPSEPIVDYPPPTSMSFARGLRVRFPFKDGFTPAECPTVEHGDGQPCPGARGAVVELFRRVAEELRFNYTLLASKDWTQTSDIVGHVQDGLADIAVGDVTVTLDRLRSNVIMTLPYHSFDRLLVTGLWQPKPFSLFAWAEPFSGELWAMLFGGMVVVAFAMWFLENDALARIIVDRAVCCTISAVCFPYTCCGCGLPGRLAPVWLRRYRRRLCSNLASIGCGCCVGQELKSEMDRLGSDVVTGVSSAGARRGSAMELPGEGEPIARAERKTRKKKLAVVGLGGATLDHVGEMDTFGAALWWASASMVGLAQPLRSNKARSLAPVWMLVVTVIMASFTSYTILQVSQSSGSGNRAIVESTAQFDVDPSYKVALIGSNSGTNVRVFGDLVTSVEGRVQSSRDYSEMIDRVAATASGNTATGFTDPGTETPSQGLAGIAMGEPPLFIMDLARRDRVGLPCPPLKFLTQTAGRAEWAFALTQAAWYARDFNHALVQALADSSLNLRAELDSQMTVSTTEEGSCLRTVVDNSGPDQAAQLGILQLGGLFVVGGIVLVVFAAWRVVGIASMSPSSPWYRNNN